MSPKLVAFAVVIFVFGFGFCVRACDVSCRIPQTEVEILKKERKCEAGIDLTAEPKKFAVVVNGKCVILSSSEGTTTSVIVASGTALDCQGSSPTQFCNTNFDICRSTKTNCTKTYEVQPNDSCFAIAESNNITLQYLQAMNPDVSCGANLQVHQQLCIAQQIVTNSTFCVGSGIASGTGSSLATQCLQLLWLAMAALLVLFI